MKTNKNKNKHPNKPQKSSNNISPYAQYKNMADDSITLQIFDIVEKNSEVSQGKIMAQTGLAAGLVHSFMSRILEKGWVRAKRVNAKRWLYFMTPEGFVEKSRLIMGYLSRTLQSYKAAQALVSQQLELCRKNGCYRLVVAGDNEVADIAVLRIKATEGFILEGILSGITPDGNKDDQGIYGYDEVRNLQFDRLWACDMEFINWYRLNHEACVPIKVTLIAEMIMHHPAPVVGLP